jgi:hypothetical protein
MQKIIALAIVLVGIGGGLALGVVLRPEATPHGQDADAMGAGSAIDQGPGGEASAGTAAGHGAIESAGAAFATGYDSGASAGGDGEAGADREYVKIGRQIIIPVVNKGETQALMLFDLAVGVPSSMTERIYATEPRLRDAFLRVLFEMSYTGAFSGTYTDERVVEELRGKLRAAARRLVGDAVGEVLILDIMRQEL